MTRRVGGGVCVIGFLLALVGLTFADGAQVSLLGWFHVIWNDRPHYVLIDDQGRSTQLVLDEAVVKPFGGPRALNRKRVKVTGVPEAAPPGAIRVVSIELE